jgi:membrane-bound lytic murein transglycosylase D
VRVSAKGKAEPRQRVVVDASPRRPGKAAPVVKVSAKGSTKASAKAGAKGGKTR